MTTTPIVTGDMILNFPWEEFDLYEPDEVIPYILLDEEQQNCLILYNFQKHKTMSEQDYEIEMELEKKQLQEEINAMIEEDSIPWMWLDDKDL